MDFAAIGGGATAKGRIGFGRPGLSCRHRKRPNVTRCGIRIKQYYKMSYDGSECCICPLKPVDRCRSMVFREKPATSGLCGMTARLFPGKIAWFGTAFVGRPSWSAFWIGPACEMRLGSASMPKTVAYGRSPWTDRFNRPTAQTLRAGLNPANGRLFDDARRRLLEIDGIREEAAWYGDCWKWVLEYHIDHSEAPLAAIVPSPLDLQLAVQVEPEFLRSISTSRMKRAVRDGLDLASEPFDTRWGVWSLQPGSLLRDLQDLILQKLRHLEKKVG